MTTPAAPGAAGRSCDGALGNAEERDFFERTIIGWHLLFAGMCLLAAVLLIVDGYPAALLLLGLLVIWYVALAVPAMRDDRRTWRNTAYLAGAFVIFTVLVWIDPSSLVLLFVLYPQTFAAVDTRSAVFATVMLTVGFTVALVAREGVSQSVVLERSLIGLVNLGFALLVGLFITGVVRQSAQRKRLLDELRETQEELAVAERSAGVMAERERLAREIHDTLAQGFTSIVMLTQAAEAALDAGADDRVRDRLVLAQRTARENLDEARSLVSALSPPALSDRGLADALRRLVDRLRDESGMDASLTCGEVPDGSPPDRDVVLLRAAQEAMANVRKHAGASHVEVDLRYDEDGALLTVRDDGRGFDPLGDASGYGLVGMRGRVEEIGGLVGVSSAPGRGTTVRVRIP